MRVVKGKIYRYSEHAIQEECMTCRRR
jgi:hypothetical protein